MALVYVLTRKKDGGKFTVPALTLTEWLQRRGETPSSDFGGRRNQLNTLMAALGMEPTVVDWTMEEEAEAE